MHPNPIFRQGDTATALADACAIGFGALIVPELPGVAAHIPFVLDERAHALDMHLVRSNPIARALKTAGANSAALLIVQGPHGYISPDWYGATDMVPTWNYVAIHLSGRLEALEDAALRGSIDRLSAQFEERLERSTGKKAWTSEKMTPSALAAMMKAIRPFRFSIERIDSTYKLGQNKQPNEIKGAIEGLATSDIGANIDALARLMAEG